MSWRQFQKKQKRREWKTALIEVGPFLAFLIGCLVVMSLVLWSKMA